MTRQEQLIIFFTDFYRKSFSLLDSERYDEILELYYDTAEQLRELVPIHFYGNTILDCRDTNVMVIANHLASPNLVLIRNQDTIRSFGLDPSKLYHESLSPVILRHYPIMRLLQRNDFSIHVLSLKNPRRLDALRIYWGSILFDKRSLTKMQKITDFIAHLPESHQGVLFFPEGGDSHIIMDNYNKLRPFKTGFVVTAKRFKLPILPVSMAFDKRTYEYHVRIHDLIDFENYSKIDSQVFSQRMRELITNGMLEAQKGFTNPEARSY